MTRGELIWRAFYFGSTCSRSTFACHYRASLAMAVAETHLPTARAYDLILRVLRGGFDEYAALPEVRREFDQARLIYTYSAAYASWGQLRKMAA